jgi:hypothetical protein
MLDTWSLSSTKPETQRYIYSQAGSYPSCKKAKTKEVDDPSRRIEPEELRCPHKDSTRLPLQFKPVFSLHSFRSAFILSFSTYIKKLHAFKYSYIVAPLKHKHLYTFSHSNQYSFVPPLLSIMHGLNAVAGAVAMHLSLVSAVNSVNFINNCPYDVWYWVVGPKGSLLYVISPPLRT